MVRIRVAGFLIEVQNRFAYTERLCAAYRTECDAPADLIVSATKEEIRQEMTAATFDAPPAYCESVCLYRNLCNALPRLNAFLLHAATVRADDAAYAFLGHSGTGKSTHIRLWMEQFSDRVEIINGDKPIIRRMEDAFVAFGTPWAGKEGLQNNISAPLKGLCFLKQAPYNAITRLTQQETAKRIFHQFLIPKDAESVQKLMQLADALVRSVPTYELCCTISAEAARLSFDTLTGGNR